jgi:hypothetical protein
VLREFLVLSMRTRETETLKKELATVKDQVTVIKERTTEVCQGECLVHRCEVAQRVAIGQRAYR